jgi:galactarate dehydratase
MRSQTAQLLRLHPTDSVAIVCNADGLSKGAKGADGLVLREDIPQAHKCALQPIAKGDAVIRYGVVIGYATEDLPAGSWVHEGVLRMPAPPALEALHYVAHDVPQPEPLTGYTFDGYRNTDGSVGTRNILGISSTVHCVAPVVEHAAARIKSELLPRYPHVDDVVAISHLYGCGVAIDAPDAYIPIRSVRNIAKNPNFGGQCLLVGLGCEKLTEKRLVPPDDSLRATDAFQFVNMQEQEGGFEGTVRAIMDAAAKRLERLDARRRQPCAASELCLGLQCGGSDAFSGAAANPAVGFASDLFVRAGATVFFSEVTEVRDGIDQLVARAVNAPVAKRLIEEMAWYDAYLAKGGVDRSANTTPGNKAGGLNNIVEKAMGSIVKSGSSPISGVFGPGEKIPVNAKGLYFVATPASDIVCGPTQVAAGMNVLLFITGRGTPYGLAAVPTIKVGTRSELAMRWHDLIDVNAGTIITHEKTIQQVGWDIFNLVLAVASGKKTWAERWGLHNYMAVFNPAPIT